MDKSWKKVRMFVSQIKDIWRYELKFRTILAVASWLAAFVLLLRARSEGEMLVAFGASLITLFLAIKLGTLAWWYLNPPG